MPYQEIEYTPVASISLIIIVFILIVPTVVLSPVLLIVWFLKQGIDLLQEIADVSNN